MKSVGEVCWSKSDVKKITKVAPGTDASEYGLSSGIADESAAARKKGNSAALDSSSASDKQALRENQKRDLADQYDRTLNKNKKFGEQ